MTRSLTVHGLGPYYRTAKQGGQPGNYLFICRRPQSGTEFDMAEAQQEQEAFFALLSTFELERPIVSVSDLADGAALFEVLKHVYVYITVRVPPIPISVLLKFPNNL